MKTLQITLHDIDEPWKIKFLKSAAGEQFLSNLQNNKQCIVAIEQNKRLKESETNQVLRHQVRLQNLLNGVIFCYFCQ